MKILAITLFFLGLALSIYLNVTWLVTLIADIINAFRSTTPVPASDIAWMIVKVCGRSLVFLGVTSLCVIPSFIVGFFAAAFAAAKD
jgi:nucleoside recognition membrane protein YjiH